MRPLTDRPDLRRVGRARALAMGILAAVVLTGCARDVAGQPAPIPSSPLQIETPGPVVELAPGAIPPPTDSVARELEAHRLAAATTMARTVFPERAEWCYSHGFIEGPFVAAVDVERAYPAPDLAAILDRYGFVAAWGTCAVDAAGMVTQTLSIELSDPASAALAVAELETTDPYLLREGTVLGGAPVLVHSDGAKETVVIWASVGRMLALAVHQAPAGLGVEQVRPLITDQLALLGTFEPTPQVDVPDLPPDPNGLAELVVDPPGKLQAYTGPYDFESVLRISPDPIRDRELLTANGFVAAYVKNSTDGRLTYFVEVDVYPGAAQVTAVYSDYAQQDVERFTPVPIVVPAVPQAPCYGFDWGATGAPLLTQRCFLSYGPYLVYVQVAGVAALDDVTAMNALLPAQRDLIGG